MSNRIVIITGEGPEHRYVANRICREFAVDAILVAEDPPRRSWKTVLRKDVFAFLDKALWRIYLRAVGDATARERDVTRILGADARGAFTHPEKVTRVGLPKAGVLRREVERLRPDWLIIYGTGIIPDSILRKATKKALNMHTGISPWYRGTACAFWPIHEGEPERVGATVHECVSKVDGGEIFQTATAQLYHGDSLHAVFARAVKSGTDAYIEVIRRALDGSLEGETQDLSQGREFRGHMRGFRAEIHARAQLRRMNRTWPREPSP